MKLFDIDWLDFYERLGVWNGLALRTRQALSKLKSNVTLEAKRLGKDRTALEEATFLKVNASTRKAQLDKSCLPFARAIRAMCRRDILAEPSTENLGAYLSDHFSHDELYGLLHESSHDYGYGYGNVDATARRVGSLRWLEAFLSLENLKQAKAWEKQIQATRYGYRHEPEQRLLTSKKVLDATQSIVQQLLSSTEPISFAELVDANKPMSLATLAAASLVGLRYVLLFATMRQDDMTPVITVWPPTRERYHRPKPEPPQAVVPDETFCCACIMEDMTTILVQASSTPLRVRASDHALFVKTQKQLESTVIATPDWLTTNQECAPERRVLEAVALLRRHDLLVLREDEGQNLRLEMADEAKAWLGLSGKRRLESVLREVRYNPPTDASSDDNAPPQAGIHAAFSAGELRLCSDPQREAYEDDDDYDYDDDFDFGASFGSYDDTELDDFLPRTSHWTVSAGMEPELSATLVRIFGSVGDGFMPYHRFVEYQTGQVNPIADLCRSGARPRVTRGWSQRKPTDEEAEWIWSDLIEAFLLQRLLPYGGARFGIAGTPAELCFSLTSVGRYILGLVDDFEYGSAHEGQGQILVQPNFDVVFLAPAPLAEATIGRFAQRVAHGPGTAFQITRKSIFTAASWGMTADDVLETLGELCSKAIPRNVAHEIRDWFGLCGRAIVQTAVVVRCPDAEIATRVMAAGGKKLTQISDTVLELVSTKEKGALIKKLKELGIFVDEPRPPRIPGTWRRPRRRW